MKILLHAQHCIASGLSWHQVIEAERLANASPAGEHFFFTKRIDENAAHPVNRWMLMALHRSYWGDRAFEGRSPAEWQITIPD